MATRISTNLTQSLEQERMMTLPETLTDAQRWNGIDYTFCGANASSVRTIPYAERYRHSTVVLEETPIERIQKAAEHAKKARRESKQRV